MNSFAHALEIVSKETPLNCCGTESRYQLSCIERIKRSMFQALKELGYEYLRYTCWVKDVNNVGDESNSFSINFSNFPTDWESYYDSHQLYNDDPLVRVLQETEEGSQILFGTWQQALAKAHDNPLGETEVQQANYQKKIKNIFDRAAEFGLVSGGYLSHSNNVRHIIISFATSRIDVEDIPEQSEFWRILFSIMMLCDQSIKETKSCGDCTKHIRIDGEESITLTKAQVKILTLFHEQRNATIKAIANKHGTSVDTINYHLKILREKLHKPGASGHALAAFAKDHNLF